MRTISDLVRTMSSYFRVGTVRLKDNSGVVEARNGGDSAYANIASAAAVLNSATHTATLQVSPSASADITMTLPVSNGTTGQVLSTDGSGVTSWTSVATASNQVLAQTEAVAYGSGSTITVFTPPANALIQKVIVDVQTAFDGTGPNLSVGVSAAHSRYLGTTEVDLTAVGVYEVSPCYHEDGTPEEVVIYFGAATGSPTMGAANVTVEYANPG